MSVQQAIAFIRHLRTNPSEARQLQGNTSLEAMVTVGASAGFDFTPEDLRTAFKNDWGVRWIGFRQIRMAPKGAAGEKREASAPAAAK